MTDKEIYDIYKNEVLDYISFYKESGLFGSVCEDENFYNFLGVIKQNVKFNGYTKSNRNYLFNIIARSYCFRKYQIKIKDKLNKLYNNKESDIADIYNLLNELNHEYKMLVLDIDAYVASKNNWTQNNSNHIQNFDDYSFLIRYLPEFMSDGVFEKIKDILFIFIDLIMYEIRTRFACTFFVGVLLLISESNYFPTHIKSISKELYCYLNKKLINSRLLGLKINSNFSEVDEICERTSRDRTSQLILVFSYNNFDSYCFRFDMAHKGVEFSHINFTSPGEKMKK